MTPAVRVFGFADARRAVAPRNVRVWVPRQAKAADVGAMPVIYLLDGQNLFEADGDGPSWHIDRTTQRLVDTGRLPPLLLVGVDHSGPQRTNEYTPVRWQRRGGHAADLAHLLIDEIKPFVDRNFPTAPGKESTTIVGSSLGGLFALHTALTRPDVFGQVAALSPSIWWANDQLLRTIDALPRHLPLRIWIDAGKTEAPPLIRAVKTAARLLQAKGWQPQRKAGKADLRHVEVARGNHDEASWGGRFGRVLKWLFPAPAKRRRRGSRRRAT